MNKLSYRNKFFYNQFYEFHYRSRLIFEINYRNKLITSIIKSNFIGGKILDIGFGSGTLFSYLKKYDLFGVDISDNAVKNIRKRFKGNFIQLDLNENNIIFKNVGFDIVVASHLLEHLKNPSDLFNYLITRSNMFIVTLPLVNNKNDSNHNHSITVEWFENLLDNNNLIYTYIDSLSFKPKGKMFPLRPFSINKMFLLFSNIVLSLMPFKFIKFVDSQRIKHGRKPEQRTYVIKNVKK